jgi:hypothetical protein
MEDVSEATGPDQGLDDPADGPTPASAPRPVPAPPAAPAPDASAEPASFGRVDEAGTVYVRRASGEVAVGSMPGDPDAALALFVRRFGDLEVQVALLEQRAASGVATPEETAASAARLRQSLAEPHAVGDLDRLAARLDALDWQLQEYRAARKAAKAEALAQAGQRKEQLASEAEQIAEGSDWRNGADRLRRLLDEWKTLPRLDRATDDALWHRFSNARTHYTRRRKTHFAELAERREQARAAKEALVAEATALSTSREWGATAAAYRDLMGRWKAAGAAPKEHEEDLWARFRAAQDAFFAARADALGQRDAELHANLTVKRDLVSEAERLLPVRDWKAARASLRTIQERWEAAGKVPRDQMGGLDSRLRRVEDAVRDAEQSQWRRANPGARARAADAVAQLEKGIADLEQARDVAVAQGDTRAAADAETALVARRSWLEQTRRTLEEFGG